MKTNNNNGNKTSVPMLVLEILNQRKSIIIDVPEAHSNSLEAIHDYLVFNPEGPKLSDNFKEEWEEVCIEVDELQEKGELYFDASNGIITLLN